MMDTLITNAIQRHVSDYCLLNANQHGFVKGRSCVTQLMSAVYTGIKKPESFSHSGFSLKVARQLPLNTPKTPNRKTHLRSVIF